MGPNVLAGVAGGLITMLITTTAVALQATSPAPPLGKYATVRLTADLSHLTDRERAMIGVLIQAAREMDAIFWQEAFGDRDPFLASLDDERVRRYAEINYGPWDRLDGNRAFIAGVSPKPPGANFYPADLTSNELDAYIGAHPDAAEALRSPYTIVRRAATGELTAVPYHEHFAEPIGRAAGLLREAAALADDAGLRSYLEARAEALLTDDYQPSDMLWMDMKDNRIDVVIGPIENYEDELAGRKAAHECYVLVKDVEWSERLAQYAELLPELQRGLPVDEAYKRESPGSNADLNAYDVVFYAGDCNAGSKTIAINLPNDEEVQLQKGSRRLQLKNAMRAKFDEIMVPIAAALMVEDQQPHVTFDAFFADTMFHEVAHGLGIKYTIDGQQTVREAHREHYSAIEEGKADILGLYMITQLHDQGVLTGAPLEDYYITFMAGIFRSVRFGAASAHGKANMIRFNFFRERGAFSREPSGRYRVDMAKMRAAMTELGGKILQLQGDGDYEAARRFVEELATIGPELQADLARLEQQGIPVDVVFEQGEAVLGLPTPNR